MLENKKLLSLFDLNGNIADLFTSYCILLKSQLKDKWLITQTSNQADIVVIEEQHKIKTLKNKLAVIVIGKSYDSVKRKKKGRTEYFYISNPLISKQIIKVLNIISELRESTNHKKDRNTLIPQTFKNFFSRFRIPRRNKVIKKRKNTVANQLLQLTNPEAKQSLKVVLLGTPGSGKTTAINALSDIKALSSEVNATDSIGLIKKQTTIGIDYGEHNLNDKLKLRLYGTPGQKRYDYMQTETMVNSDIYIILIDLTSSNPTEDLKYFTQIIQSSNVKNTLTAVIFTHCDQTLYNIKETTQSIRNHHGESLFISQIDPRVKEDVSIMMNSLVDLLKMIKH